MDLVVPTVLHLLLIFCSNVILGETILEKNPDCLSCAPVQDIEVESTKVHEDWNQIKFAKGNDIGLIRLKKPAVLFVVMYQFLQKQLGGDA